MAALSRCPPLTTWHYILPPHLFVNVPLVPASWVMFCTNPLRTGGSSSPWRRRLPPLLVALIVAAAATLISPAPTAAIQFDVAFGGQRCITEELTSDTTVNGLVHVADGPSAMKVDVFVSDAQGNVHYHKAGAVHEAFSFKTSPAPPSRYGGHEDPRAATPYRVCVHHASGPEDLASGYRRGSSGTVPTRRVTLTLTQGLTPSAREGLATRQNVDMHVERVRELEFQLQAVVAGIDDMKAVEADVLRKNDDTNLRVLWYSVAACAVMIGAGAYQVFYMKAFFKRAKLI